MSVPCFAACAAGAAWNRAHLGDPLAEASALLWSVTAMSEATARLPQAGIGDRDQAPAVIGEAVWWVTLVDATLVRHHPEACDAVLAGQFAAQRPLIEQTLAGLRFVRNQAGGEAGLARFAQAAAPGPGGRRRAAHRLAVEAGAAAGAGLAAAAARAWEMTRYRAYQAQLAGHTIGETFRQAATFLTLTAARAGSLADLASAHAHNGSN